MIPTKHVRQRRLTPSSPALTVRKQKMKITAPILLLLTIMLTGCWVRIAGNDKSPFYEYVGRVGTSQTEYVVVDIMRSTYVATPKGQYFDEDHKGYVMTLEKGIEFKVTGTASRRLESGVHHYLECRVNTENKEIIFDYPAGGYWEPLSSKYIKWDKPINSNEASETTSGSSAPSRASS